MGICTKVRRLSTIILVAPLMLLKGLLSLVIYLMMYIIGDDFCKRLARDTVIDVYDYTINVFKKQ